VLDDLDGRIDAVLDGGATDHGVESTVLDPGQSPMVIYRPGAVTTVQIRDTAGAVEVFRDGQTLAGQVLTGQMLVDTPQAALPSPGVGLRHYAPRARLILVDAPLGDLPARLTEEATRWPEDQIGVMLPAEVRAKIPGSVLYPWGRWSAPEELAHGLYAGLRWLDAQGCTVILCPLPAEEGVGAAMRDRLRKAARAGAG
jgi:L-threonylcarbamoyladenylate synthase